MKRVSENREEQEANRLALKMKHDKARQDFERHKQDTNKENRANLRGFMKKAAEATQRRNQQREEEAHRRTL